MNPALKRVLRTIFQTSTAGAVVLGWHYLVHPLAPEAAAAATTLLSIAFSAIQNGLNDALPEVLQR